MADEGIVAAEFSIFMVRRGDVQRPLESANGNFDATFESSSRCASGSGRPKENMNLCLFRYAFVGANG